MLREPSARFDLALIQIKPISSLNRAFQLSMLQGMLSKISLFLMVQMIQQAIMTISLKMIFPKFVQVPKDAQIGPAVLTESTLKEKMHTGFFQSTAANRAYI